MAGPIVEVPRMDEAGYLKGLFHSEDINVPPPDQSLELYVSGGPEGKGKDKDKGKGKGKAVDVEPEVDVGTTDGTQDAVGPSDEDAQEDDSQNWTRYDPPEALAHVPEAVSEVIRQLVWDSIDRVKRKIAEEEEDRRRKVEEEAAAAAAAASASGSSVVDHSTNTDVAEATSSPHAKPRDEAAQLAPQYPSAESLLQIDLPNRPFTEPDGFHERLSRAIKGIFRPKTSGVKPAAPPKLSKIAAEKAPEHTTECVSCFDDIPIRSSIKAPCHDYCRECFERLITTAIENEAQWPPKCCLNEIPPQTVKTHASRGTRNRYLAKSVEFKVPISERIYCPYPDCGVFVEKRSIVHRETATCRRGHKTCIRCRQLAHQGGDCPLDRDRQLTEELAREEGWQHCIKCGILVEHKEACHHMTCRCGASFCYLCLAPWQTCSCTGAQLQRVKDDAALRRQQRRLAEMEAEREEREAVEAVQAFIREEERKARLLREREEELRHMELERRRAAETQRRLELAARFGDHRATLAELSRLQAQLLDSRHREHEEVLARETAGRKRTLRQKQEADLARLAAETESLVREKEAALRSEYAARVRDEARLEAEYRASLAPLWAGRADGEARRGAALAAYMRHNDAEMGRWRALRERELAAERHAAEEERDIRVELMAKAREWLDDGLARQAEEMAERHAAEDRWGDVLLAERRCMLAELEELEAAHGGEAEEDVEQAVAAAVAAALDDDRSFYSVGSNAGEGAQEGAAEGAVDGAVEDAEDMEEEAEEEEEDGYEEADEEEAAAAAMAHEAAQPVVYDVVQIPWGFMRTRPLRVPRYT